MSVRVAFAPLCLCLVVATITDPIVVLPPVLYWNASNEISVVWPGNSQDPTIDLALKVSAQSLSQPVFHNLWHVQPGEPNSFVFTVPPADDYRLELIKSINQETITTESIGGAPNLREVFLETDKPIYKAAQKVRVRACPITHDGRLYEGSLEFHLENPDRLILMSKSSHVTDGTFAKVDFDLPRYLKLGVWKVRVHTPFEQKLLQWDTVFEIQDYDLPNFDVLLSAKSPDQFESNVTDVTVIAKYSFGRAVTGPLQILCKTVESESELLIDTKLLNGHYETKLDIRKCRRSPVFELKALVRDEGTAEQEWALFSYNQKETGFRLVPLKPAFTNTNSNFVVLIQSTGSLLETTGIEVHLSVICASSSLIREIMTFTTLLDHTVLIKHPYHCDVMILNATRGKSSFVIAVPQLQSEALDFALIENVPRAVYEVGETFEGGFRGEETDFAIMVLCNDNQLVLHQKFHADNIRFGISHDMFGECVLIAYTTEDGVRKTDMLKFFVKSRCDSELQIQVPSRPVSPSTEIGIAVRAKPHSIIGLKAVDERISYVAGSQKQIDTNVLDWEFFLGSMGEGHVLQSTQIIGLFDHNKIQDDISKLCFNIGPSYWQNRSMCPSFSATNSLTALDCQEKIRSSCYQRVQENGQSIFLQSDRSVATGIEITVVVSKPVCQESSWTTKCRYQSDPDVAVNVQDLGAGSIPGSQQRSQSFKIRRLFPEVWLFEEVKTDSLGHVQLKRVLPDTVTNWTLSAQSWAPDQLHMCSAADKTITSFKDFFLKIDLPEKARLGERLAVKASVFLLDPHWIHSRDPNIQVAICTNATVGACIDQGFDGRRNEKKYTMALLRKDQYSASKEIHIEFMQVGQHDIEFQLHTLVGEERSCWQGQLLDKVRKTIIVEDRENVQEYYRSFILTPMKPRTGLTLNRLHDDMLYFSEKIYTNANNERVLQVFMGLNITDDIQVQSFRLEYSRFLPKISPYSIVDGKRSRRTKRTIQTPYLVDVLKKLAVVLYQFKTLAISTDTAPTVRDALDAQLATLLAETVTFGDCATNLNMCGYSELRWPGSADMRSQWLTVLTTLMHCEQSVSPTIVCPSLRWVLNLTATGRLKSDFKQTHLASNDDESKFLKTLVFLMLYQCNSYWETCEGTSAMLRRVSSHLYQSLFISGKATDPIAVAATAYAGAEYRSALVIKYQDYLLDLVNKDYTAPFWTYKSADDSLMDKVKDWFGYTKKRSEQQSNEILMNSLGLLAFLQWKSRDSALDLEPLADWLHDQQKQDGSFIYALDSYFASRALFEFQLHKSGISRQQRNMTLFINCDGCAKTLHNVTDQLSIAFIPSAVRELTVDAIGLDKIKLAIRLQLTQHHRPKRGTAKNNWPVDMSATTASVDTQPNLHEHIVCLNPQNKILHTLFVEHGLFTGFQLEDGSFTILNGTASQRGPLEASSLAVHFMLVNVSAGQSNCYQLRVAMPKDTHVSSEWAPAKVSAQHSEHGTVGELLLRLDHKQLLIPDPIDKFCYPDGQCVCAEGACTSRKCAQCTDTAVQQLTDGVCDPEKFAAVMTATEVSETISGDYVKMRATIKHLVYHHAADQSLTRLSLDACSQADVWRRLCTRNGDCAYPRLEAMYFLSGHMDRWKVEGNSTRWTYFIEEGDQWEEFLHCGPRWQSRFLNLTDRVIREKMCTNAGR